MDVNDDDGNDSLYNDGVDDDNDNGYGSDKGSAIESADVSSQSDVFDEFDVGLYGLKDVCFEEEVGLRDDGGVDSQRMNG